MKIDAWHIEGFGIFHEFALKDLSPGLNVFLGPNEAGKSTLLDFLRGVLFGFPTARSTKRYYPLRGGKHGGRIWIETALGNYIVERFPGKKPSFQLTLPSGNPGAEADLVQVLGGADRKLFTSVFAFGLDELSSADILTTEEIRDRIFSAGISGAGNSARKIISELESRNEELLRPRASSKIITLVSELEAIKQKLDSLREQAKNYPALLESENKAKEKVAALQEQKESLLSKLSRCQMLLQLWSPYFDLKTAQRHLHELGAVPELDAHAEKQYTQLSEQVRALSRQMQEFDAEKALLLQGSATGQNAALVVDATLSAEQENVLTQVRSGLQERELLTRQITFAENLHREKEAENAVPPVPQSIYWLLPAASIIALLVSVWKFAAQDYFMGALILCFAVLFAAGALLLKNLAIKPAASVDLPAKDRELALLKQQLASISQQISTALSELGLAPNATLSEIDDKTASLRGQSALAKLELKRKPVESELAQVMAQRQKLYAKANASNEADYEGVLAKSQRKRELERTIEAKNSLIIYQIGEGNDAQSVWAELETGQVNNWRTEHAARETELSQVKLELEQARRAQFGAEQERKALEVSAVIGELENSMEMLREELKTSLEQWLVRELSKSLIAQTLSEFSRTRQPAVLAQAAKHFFLITKRYKTIVQEEDGKTLAVIADNGERKLPEQLSRGTMEQLYLCLRLGLAAEYAQRTCALPLVMDDVLVNFDPERAKAVAQAVLASASAQQILLFTCHPSTVSLLCELAPETKVFSLEN
jgi:uncharacterized protein YhaN